jgi:hypothetical protein
LSAQSPRNPVAQLLQTLIKELIFLNFEDYKLHFFPALRAVVLVLIINEKRSKQLLDLLLAQVQITMFPGTNEFSK